MTLDKLEQVRKKFLLSDHSPAVVHSACHGGFVLLAGIQKDGSPVFLLKADGTPFVEDAPDEVLDKALEATSAGQRQEAEKALDLLIPGCGEVQADAYNRYITQRSTPGIEVFYARLHWDSQIQQWSAWVSTQIGPYAEGGGAQYGTSAHAALLAAVQKFDGALAEREQRYQRLQAAVKGARAAFRDHVYSEKETT